MLPPANRAYNAAILVIQDQIRQLNLRDHSAEVGFVIWYVLHGVLFLRTLYLPIDGARSNKGQRRMTIDGREV